MAYGIALETVNPQLNQIGAPGPYCGYGAAIQQVDLPAGTPSIYCLAVYSLSTDQVFQYALDVQPPVIYIPPSGQSNPEGLSYFAYYRQLWKMNDFTPGVVQSTSDEGTSVSLVVPDAFQELTIGQLANLQTPWGRRYLALAQSTGPNWGLT